MFVPFDCLVHDMINGPRMSLPAADLDHVLEHTSGLWEDLRNQRLFITGGTGFFGCWLLESFVWASDHLGLNAEAVVLTRRPEAFAKKMPHLAQHRSIQLHAGDVRSFELPAGQFSQIIHGATDASVVLNEESPLLMFDTIAEGTRRTLEFARQCGAKQYLFVSSGAVYGRQPPNVTHVAEDHSGAPLTTDERSAYGEGKRVGEMLAAMYARRYQLEAKIARCFAFTGPHLPLDTHFAVGNFIRNAIRGEPIEIKGDGTPYRSYLYAADLAVWLWTILLRGKNCQPYNVGSESALSIADLAQLVTKTLAPSLPVRVLKKAIKGQLPERYVPSTALAQRELKLSTKIELAEAIRRTANWASRT